MTTDTWRLMEELTGFRTFHGLLPYPVEHDPTPLLPPLYLVDGKGRPRAGVAARQVHALLKDRHRDVARVFDAPDETTTSDALSITPKPPSQPDML